MWALRRACNLKNQGFSIRSSRACCSKSEVASYCLDDKTSTGDFHLFRSDGCMYWKRFNGARHGYPKVFMGSCSFSSQAKVRSSTLEEDDLEDGFSELETPASMDVIQDGKVAEDLEELISGPDLSEEEDDIDVPQNVLEFSDAQADVTSKSFQGERTSYAMFKAIMAVPGASVESVLNKWVEDGNDLSREEIYSVNSLLRRRRLYGRALQLSEWLESTKHLDFHERDYASRLNLIAKVHGLQSAGKYIMRIPKSFRGEIVYRTLLASFVSAGNTKRAEELFNKMKDDLGFPVSTFACVQLLLLYNRFNKKKIADVLLLMEKENVKPDNMTYKILINVKGQSNDINGMEQIVETMKAEGIEPNVHIKSLLAKHYICNGFKEKAEAVLQELEGENLEENREGFPALLCSYAALGRAKDVERIWKVCESNPRYTERLAAIEAWGKLKKIDKAEAVFDKMLKTLRKVSSKQYDVLLRVYVNHKMLAKGKDLVKQMADRGCHIGSSTWDQLTKLYIKAGEVEKADSFLQKAFQQNKFKPAFRTYEAILEQYAKRGDVHNTEKIFVRMREAGYIARLQQFETLIQAYINAKSPAYGMKDRLKAENIFTNKSMEAMLAQVNPFRKTTISDLLD